MRRAAGNRQGRGLDLLGKAHTVELGQKLPCDFHVTDKEPRSVAVGLVAARLTFTVTIQAEQILQKLRYQSPSRHLYTHIHMPTRHSLHYGAHCVMTFAPAKSQQACSSCKNAGLECFTRRIDPARLGTTFRWAGFAVSGCQPQLMMSRPRCRPETSRRWQTARQPGRCCWR